MQRKRSFNHIIMIVFIPLLMNSLEGQAQGDSIQWFAHRGFLGLHPENTIKGMKRALHYKSVVLEMDLAITKDKQVVISHDPVLNRRITLDSNGRQLPEDQKVIIYQTSYDELSTYDVGTKPNARFPKQVRFKAHIPRLADLIDSIERYAVQEGLKKPFYFLETKLKSETDGKYHPAPDEFTALVLGVIYQKGVQNRVIIQSFDPRTLQIIHRGYPNIPVAFLSKRGTTLADNLNWLGFVPTYYSAKPELITPEFMEQLNELGISPIVGVFNGYDEFQRLKNLGVKGYIADYPIEYLEERK